MHYRFSLIGYPINHSLSPWIHKHFLKKAGLEGEYTIYEIDQKTSLGLEMEKLKSKQLHGFNVTVPYKQKILPLLDKVDDTARKMGAVNTVVNENGIWTGYNTDGIGYLRSLESKFPELFRDKSNSILVIGAGGAARGIYAALSDEGFNHIDIANRTENSAVQISEIGNKKTKTTILTLKEAELAAGNYDIIVQTTSVGMKPAKDRSIISLEHIKETAIASDIIYQPINTVFLQQAKNAGASIHYGHTMLLYQAQYAFELWTGEKVPIDGLDQKLLLELKGR
ncbi:shikimate dehydrogenase [Virgibacillus sp. YIM 98842]|uniref:shikimate dehydrogenase n=1 Tax=Virgibacillus sp. YIM 98842 TaxID=2663533 RepID=UPI0013D90538|nr:shikimate dehydrogenase [Virgibacillus sp. YIM 98842]